MCNIRIPKIIFQKKRVHFPGEGNGSSFTNIEIHEVSSAPTLYRINIELQLTIIIIKIIKYEDLIIEIQYTWNVKTKVTPVIIGATGTISKSFRKYLSSIPRRRNIKELQKTAILGTAHILRKVLM
jgi:hypothetical protein